MSYVDPKGLRVYSIGLTGGLNIPFIGPVGIAATWSVGLVWDSHCGIGIYGTSTNVPGVGIGAGASVATSGSVFGGETIGSFAGPFDSASVGAGLGPYGSYDSYRDPSKSSSDPSVYGAGVSVGVGLKGSGSLIRTDTTVIPIHSPNKNSCGCN